MSTTAVEQQPSHGRERYVDVGRAIRQAHARAREVEITSAERDVLSAIVDLVCSYSRLTDGISIEQLAVCCQRHPKTVAKALARLDRLRIVVYRPGGGKGRGSVSQIGLPAAERVALEGSPSSTEGERLETPLTPPEGEPLETPHPRREIREDVTSEKHDDGFLGEEGAGEGEAPDLDQEDSTPPPPATPSEPASAPTDHSLDAQRDRLQTEAEGLIEHTREIAGSRGHDPLSLLVEDLIRQEPLEAGAFFSRLENDPSIENVMARAEAGLRRGEHLLESRAPSSDGVQVVGMDPHEIKAREQEGVPLF